MAFYRAALHIPAASAERIGILLVNLGTPSRPAYLAVWRYLRTFLGDRRVIDSPRVIWLPALYGFVLTLRSFRTVRNYRKVWMREGSPLAVYSKALAEKFAAAMASAYGDRVRVRLAMTYGEPSIRRGLRELMQADVTRLLIIPLYPQYSSTTTGAVFDAVSEALRSQRRVPELRFVSDYHAERGYIDAIARSVLAHWQKFGRAHLLISFHGIPQVYVAQGDPYRAQAERTARAIAARLELSAGDWTLTYQSRFGPVLWLQPYTEDTLRELAARGVLQVTVVSPSFAVDCLETLEEISVEYRAMFARLGGRLTMVPALNDDSAHVSLLETLAARNLRDWLSPET